MPFNPDKALAPEETHPDADRRLFAAHSFLEDVMADIVKRAKEHRQTATLHDLAIVMEAVQDMIHDETKGAVEVLRETYPDTSATPEDWQRKLEEAAKELAV